MSRDSQFLGQFTIPQNFDSVRPTISKADRPQSRFINSRAIIKTIERLKIHGQVTGAVARVVKSSFWNSPDQRHLAAFETNPDGTARTRGLALATASAGFAVPRGLTLAEPLAAVLGARPGFEIM